jgi:hypothetical protein
MGGVPQREARQRQPAASPAPRSGCARRARHGRRLASPWPSRRLSRAPASHHRRGGELPAAHHRRAARREEAEREASGEEGPAGSRDLPGETPLDRGPQGVPVAGQGERPFVLTRRPGQTHGPKSAREKRGHAQIEAGAHDVGLPRAERSASGWAESPCRGSRRPPRARPARPRGPRRSSQSPSRPGLPTATVTLLPREAPTRRPRRASGRRARGQAREALRRRAPRR